MTSVGDRQDDPEARAAREIRRGRYISLATSSSEGEPWCAPVAYVETEQEELLFASSVYSRHARDLSDTGCIAGAIFDSTRLSAEVDGVQLAGECLRIPDDRVPQYGEMFATRYCVKAHEVPQEWNEVRAARWMSSSSLGLFAIKVTKVYVLDQNEYARTGSDKRLELRVARTWEFLRRCWALHSDLRV
jgi:uncharacterized protein YhbP (UPF0306 family)